MKINVKPKLITATDYHDFGEICENTKKLTGIEFDYWEVEPNYDYRAIVWPEGAEDELFEFIFVDQEAWETSIKE